MRIRQYLFELYDEGLTVPTIAVIVYIFYVVVVFHFRREIFWLVMK